MTIYLFAYAAGLLALVGVIAARRLDKRLQRLLERKDRYFERIETISNYNKLAAVRIAEAEETCRRLRGEIGAAKEQHRATAERIQEARASSPAVVYVFDRLDNRKDKLFEFVVESLNDGADWSGKRHYIVAGATVEKAAERVRARFPKMSGYHVSAGAERKSY